MNVSAIEYTHRGEYPMAYKLLTGCMLNSYSGKMTEATDYTKLTLSDREHTSNGELEHATFVMEDKETECKEKKSKWIKCKRFAMDTKKRFLNKVQNLNRRETAGIAVLVTVLVLFIMSAVSSSEVHSSLDEKIELINTTQAVEIEALRKKFDDYQQQNEAKFELMLSMHINKSNAIDSLNTTVSRSSS